jgi:radical SAM superfamily enzyme YgiQ (UPF0313 family)
MRILLLAMPDSASSLDRVMKFPNLGLCSIAGQVRAHEVRILDLVLQPKGVLRRVLDEVVTFQPDLVGYSAMSFQYATARSIARAIHTASPHALHILGRYHATVLFEEVGARDPGIFDFIIRGEGEIPFRQLVEGLSERARSRHGPESLLAWSERLPPQSPRRAAPTRLTAASAAAPSTEDRRR